MFIAALFTIAKIWKQPKCPTTDEWIKKMWCIYIHNGILLSHLKKRNLAICNNMNEHEGIMLSEISQTEKDKYCTFSLIYRI